MTIDIIINNGNVITVLMASINDINGVIFNDINGVINDVLMKANEWHGEKWRNGNDGVISILMIMKKISMKMVMKVMQ